MFETKRFKFFYKSEEVSEKLLWENHCHTYFEMIFVVEGDISIVIEGRALRLTDGMAVFIPPLFYHSVTANAKGKYERVTVSFEEKDIYKEIKKEFISSLASPLPFEPKNAENLKKICKEENRFFAPLAEGIMTENFYTLLDAKNTPDEEINNDLLKILDYLDSHLFEKITLDDIAKHLCISKSSLCHLFKDKMKVSLKQYIIDKKLALSVKMIEEGELPTTVALKLGYTSYSNFYRIYKSRFFSSPKKKK